MTASHSIGAVTIALLAAAFSLRAQQTPTQQSSAQQPPAQQPAAPAPKPLVPVAASTLADTPDAYFGQPVSVVGAVERALTATAFTIDQDRTRSTGKEVLVIAPTLNSPVEANTYVTVLGEAVRFDAAELASRLTIDLPDDLAAGFAGRPAIVATAVLDTSMVDLARKLPPPMSPEEQAYASVMKRIGPAFTALRQAMTASDAEAVREQARILQKGFDDTIGFWKSHRRQDAVQWAADAKTHGQAIEHAAGRGDWDAVKAAAGSLGQSCQACHGTYRERLEDGTYRIKGLK
jgi:cytochrome c556